MITAGIDIGSRTIKTIITKNKKIISHSIMSTGADSSRRARRVFKKALSKTGLKRNSIKYIIATGYGRLNVDFSNEEITEITCHAYGAYNLFKNTGTIIDIGGQDSKVISLDLNGRVDDFVMNDKCAAGTGRFLEVMADSLEVPLEKIGEISLLADRGAEISSTCTVFAESEVISLVADGIERSKILRGLHESVSRRITSMVNKVGLKKEVTMTGGVCLNEGLRKILQKELKTEINVPERPQFVGALGAALIASLKAEEAS
ncbi:MAG: acyl-CoA dehydratase activase [Halanaerobiales bacterium]